MPLEKWPMVETFMRQLGVSGKGIWRVERARDYLADLSNAGAPLLPDFTLHNHIHSDRVIFVLARLQSQSQFELNEHEACLLAMAAYLHDLGMFFGREMFRQEVLPNPARALPACPENRCDRIQNYRLEGKEIGEQICETHNLLSALMLRTDSTIHSFVEPDDLPCLMTVCRGHRKANLREQGCTCYQSESLAGDVIRVGLLAALLRLADALNLCKCKSPEQIFRQRALDFIKSPTALERWLRHYFVTDPHITREDQGGNIALVCRVNFSVPTKQVNGESYIDFFRPLFEKHVEELNEQVLDINQQPPVFGKVLGITAMRVILVEDERDGFRDLPTDIIRRIEESGCKNVLAFLQWLRRDIGGSEGVLGSSAKSPAVEGGNPFYHLRAIDHVEYFCDFHAETEEALGLLCELENVEVTGPRKIGKTSFLRHISRPVIFREHGLSPWLDIFVYVDCQHRMIQEEESLVYKRMLHCIVDAACRAGVDLGPELCDGSAAGTTFERVLKEMSSQGLRTILLLDEFEEMVRNPNLDSSFFSHLRALWSANDVKLAYVTASCAHLVDLFSTEGALLGCPFFEIFQPIRLKLFDEENSRHLVENSLRRADTSIPGELLGLVLEVGGGHPFFLQMAGYHAFDLSAQVGDPVEDMRSVLLDAVNTEAVRHFKFYWRRLDGEEQYVLAALPLLWKEASYEETIEYLREQCLITARTGRPGYFSPLFEAFVRCQKVTGLLQVGPLLVDQRRGQVLLHGKQLELAATHFRLLACLLERSGQVVSNEELWQAAWPEEPYRDGEKLRVNIEGLCKALGDDADCIVDRRGLGYIFQYVSIGFKKFREKHRTASPSSKSIIGRKLGSVRVVEEIGSGGMATVYKAYQHSLGRYVAVKVLFCDVQRDEFLQRFQQEAQTVAQLRHPNILSVHEFGQEDDLAYIVMDFVSGGTLADLISDGLALKRAVEIAIQIGDALHCAHEQGIVHRDVKPANILIEMDGRPLLTDFGLVKFLTVSERITKTGIGVGTAAYVAPEQASGEDVDARSDVYALGIVLYEMVTGCLPFEAEDGITMVLKKLQDLPPSPRQFNESLPRQVEEVILKAMAPRPKNRYQSAQEMIEALKALRSVIS